MEKKFAALKC